MQRKIQVLLTSGLILFGGPAFASNEIQSHFLNLSATAQSQTDSLQELYQQVSDLWQEDRLDPDVSADAVRKILDESSEFLHQVEQAEQDKNKANSKAQSKKEEPEPQELKQKIYADLIRAQIQLMPSRQVELRGALLDGGLLPQTEAGMQWYLHRLKQAGFNAVFPEVFRRGYALFPNPIVEQEPPLQASQTDVLKLVTDAAHKEGLKVYPWFWMFRVLSPTISRENNLVRHLPALRSHPLDGDAYHSNGEIEDESTAFFSPAASEWRELMTDLIKYTTQKYPVQGILMDYIRYGNKQTEDELSQTRFQLDYFHKVGSFPPTRIDPASDLQASWHLWRENQVNQMVESLHDMLSQKAVEPALGGAVFRNEVQARNTKMQNWRHWSNNHWVNYISPMMYTADFHNLDLWMDWETDQGTRHDMLYPIIGAHKIQQNRLELLDQIYLLQQRHANGISIFSMRNINEQMLQDLSEGPYRLPATIPHEHIPNALVKQLQISAHWVKGLEQRGRETGALSASSRKLLLPLAQNTEQAANSLAHQQAKHPRVPGSQAVSIVKDLLELANDSTRSFPPHLRSRLLQHYEDALELAQVYDRQADTAGDHYVPPTRPPSAVIAEARPLPETTIPVATSAPQIDGRVDDPAWKNARVLPPLFWSTGAAHATTPTEIRLSYDDEALYIAYINDEPRTDRMRISHGDTGALLNQDDSVQVFLNPVEERRHYYYFVVNPDNQRYQRASFDQNWSRPWRSATRAFSHGWITEIAIPFASLNVMPPGQDDSLPWHGNFCRRRPQEINDFQCWSFTFGGVHRIDRFGTLNFAPMPQPSASPTEPKEAP